LGRKDSVSRSLGVRRKNKEWETGNHERQHERNEGKAQISASLPIWRKVRSTHYFRPPLVIKKSGQETILYERFGWYTLPIAKGERLITNTSLMTNIAEQKV
jgi:hypothetical protein